MQVFEARDLALTLPVQSPGPAFLFQKLMIFNIVAVNGMPGLGC